MTSSDRSTVPASIIFGYGVGSLGTGIFSSVPSVLLLFYMTNILAIPAAWAALAIFIPKFWDVVTDPIMGFISDKTRSPWGRRRPYLLAGALLMSITFIFLFNTPVYDNPLQSFVHVLVIFTLSATAYTVFAVPYIAMPAEMSADHRQRTSIVATRMFFVMGGLLLGSALAPYLVAWFGGGRSGFRAMSLLLGIVCAASMLLTFFATRSANQTEASQTHPNKLSDLIMVFSKTPAFPILAGIYLLQLAAMGVFSAAAPYFVTYVLRGSAELIGSFFLALLSASLFAMPLWSILARRAGKRLAFSLAAAVFGLGSASLIIITAHSSPLALYMHLTMTGVGLAGIQMLPFAMLTDVIRQDAATNGVQREGAFTGLWTACEKLGLAVGPVIVGVVLSHTGFQESTAEVAIAQSEAALDGVRWVTAVFPGAVIAVSAALVYFYPIRERDLDALTAVETARP